MYIKKYIYVYIIIYITYIPRTRRTHVHYDYLYNRESPNGSFAYCTIRYNTEYHNINTVATTTS